MDSNMEAIKELVNGISYLIDSKFNNRSTQIQTGIIMNVSYSDSTYTVKINETLYDNVPTITNELKPNQIVKVVIPQGQYNQMFIMGYIH